MKKLTLLVLAAILCCMISCEKNINEPIKPRTGTENGHDYIDLGLPSGLKWATCNVGASSPEGYGDYFAWGETSPKIAYDWGTYKYCNGSKDMMTKYCTNSYWGIVDNKTILEPKDDAAHVNWGGNWRMPTYDEFNELKNNCTWTWSYNYNRTKVSGYIVSSKKNRNSIFLPAAGYWSRSSLSFAGSNGSYNSSSLNEDLPSYTHTVSLVVRATWSGAQAIASRDLLFVLSAHNKITIFNKL